MTLPTSRALLLALQISTYRSTEHQVLQIAVTDLSTKIDALTAQESELSSQHLQSYTYMYNQLPPRPVPNLQIENLML